MALSPVSGAPVVATMDQTADLWLKIDQFHLNYLKSDENTKKIDIRKKLEDFIEDQANVDDKQNKDLVSKRRHLEGARGKTWQVLVESTC